MGSAGNGLGALAPLSGSIGNGLDRCDTAPELSDLMNDHGHVVPRGLRMSASDSFDELMLGAGGPRSGALHQVGRRLGP